MTGPTLSEPAGARASTKMMLAARAYRGERDLRLERIPVPVPDRGEVLMRVVASGLTPGPLALWRNGRMSLLPTTLGQETAGTVEGVGPGVHAVSKGSRVRVHSVLTCKECSACRSEEEVLCRHTALMGMAELGDLKSASFARYHDGGLAEYQLVPAENVDLLPSAVSFDVGARVHYLGVALSAMRKAGVGPGSTLTVVGGSGAAGAAVVGIARALGAARVIAVARRRQGLEQVRELAAALVEPIALDDLGPDWASGLLAQRVKELTNGEGSDAALDFTPVATPATLEAIQGMRRGGCMVFTGTGRADPCVPYGMIVRTGYQVRGSFALNRRDAKDVLAMLGEGRLAADDLISHRYALTDLQAACQLIDDRSDPHLLVNVHPGGDTK